MLRTATNINCCELKIDYLCNKRWPSMKAQLRNTNSKAWVLPWQLASFECVEVELTPLWSHYLASSIYICSPLSMLKAAGFSNNDTGKWAACSLRNMGCIYYLCCEMWFQEPIGSEVRCLEPYLELEIKMSEPVFGTQEPNYFCLLLRLGFPWECA